MKKAFLFSEELNHGGYPESCPFNTKRAGLVRKKADLMGLLAAADIVELPPQPLSRAEMLKFHDPGYLQLLEQAGRGQHSLAALNYGIGTEDCPVFPDMLNYLALAAGGTLTGARLILAGEAGIVFNPSGGFHHAAPARAAGFCFINDIVLGAMELAAAGLRTAILDVDVHHFDGVQDAFYTRGDILTISLHESGKTLFPGTGDHTETGSGKGAGCNINIPLPVGTYDAAYLRAFHRIVLPVLQSYRPEVLILEIGMDTLAGDPLAHLHLTNNVFVDILLDLLGLGIPILATGGGGYHVDHTVRGWTLAWNVLCEGAAFESLSAGMGGVMLENADWAGGLRDRALITDAGQRSAIDREIETVLQSLADTLGSRYHLT